MHFGLTDEQQMIVDTVRSFVENEIYPHEDLVERTGEVPKEIAQDIKQKTIDLGFYACNFPESVGCAGLSHLEFALVERELGCGSMALTHFFGRPQNNFWRFLPYIAVYSLTRYTNSSKLTSQIVSLCIDKSIDNCFSSYEDSNSVLFC